MIPGSRWVGGVLIDEKETVDTLNEKIRGMYDEIWHLERCRDALKEEQNKTFHEGFNRMKYSQKKGEA